MIAGILTFCTVLGLAVCAMVACAAEREDV